MEEKQTEMSLDEVLSSIRQMVVDKDPPVLELTDMVSADGTIVKVQNGQKEKTEKSELRDFLRLAQEQGQDSPFHPNTSSEEKPSMTEKKLKETFDAAFDAVSDSVSEFVSNSAVSDSVVSEESKELPKHTVVENPKQVRAIIENPISSSEANGATKITVNEIIREVSAPIIREWLEKNLPGLVKEVVAEEIRKMIKQN